MCSWHAGERQAQRETQDGPAALHGALEMVARGRAEPADDGVTGSGTCCDCFSGAVACETSRGNTGSGTCCDTLVRKVGWYGR